jgi:hypothetical protein
MVGARFPPKTTAHPPGAAAAAAAAAAPSRRQAHLPSPWRLHSVGGLAVWGLAGQAGAGWQAAAACSQVQSGAIRHSQGQPGRHSQERRRQCRPGESDAGRRVASMLQAGRQAVQGQTGKHAGQGRAGRQVQIPVPAGAQAGSGARRPPPWERPEHAEQAKHAAAAGLMGSHTGTATSGGAHVCRVLHHVTSLLWGVWPSGQSGQAHHGQGLGSASWGGTGAG